VSAERQRPSSCSLSYRKTGSGFKNRGVTPSVIFSKFGIQQFSSLLPTEDVLLGRHFISDGELREAVTDWLAQQTQDILFRGIYGLVQHRKTRVERGGDYAED